MKYALQGSITSATQAISDMPQIWSDCLKGKGIIDLSQVPILSQYQYLWSTGSFTSKLAGFFSGLVLKGDVKTLDKKNAPEIFQHTDFKGQVYSLNEMVIDVNTLIRELAKPHKDIIYKIDSLNTEDLHCNENGTLESIDLHAKPLESIQLRAQRFIFTAGNGNAVILNKLNHPEIKMQQRPLQMVVVKTDFLYSVYAHCLGLGATPRVTITTHKSHAGKMIWYIGGQIAEEGVTRTQEEQIAVAKKELSGLFPWLDFSRAEFAAFFVDRAEAAQPDKKRPDSCSVKQIRNVMIAWPTKLAFAPKLTHEIIEKIQHDNLLPQLTNTQALHAWPTPAFVKPIWDELLP